MKMYLLCLAMLANASAAYASGEEATPGEKIKAGAENVKEGTGEAVREAGAAAQAAGQNATEVAKKVGTKLKSATCPVVGDRKTKLYYAPDSKSYEEVLSGQKYFEDDDRECFLTEKKARDLGYSRSTN